MPSLGAAEIVLCAGIAVVAFFGPLSALVLIVLGRSAGTRCRRDLPEGWASR